jgi:hypothetical protein
MKALEFETVLTPDHTLAVPPAVVLQIPPGKLLRVMVLVTEEEDHQDEPESDEPFPIRERDCDTLYDESAGG